MNTMMVAQHHSPSCNYVRVAIMAVAVILAFLHTFGNPSFSESVTTKAAPSTTPAEYLPLPDKVFREWRQAHSKSVLFSEPRSSSTNRSFLVAEYSCPRQAGNILHDFTTTLLLAIATNRTLVFRYFVVSPWNRLQLNNETECESIFRRQDWIPRYENVLEHFNLSEDVLFRVAEEDWFRRNFSMPVESVAMHQFVRPSNFRGMDQAFVRHGSLWRGLVNLNDDERSTTYLTKLFGVSFDMKIIQQLYSEGIHYLYGMLLFESFRFTEKFRASTKSNVPALSSNLANQTVFSVGLHSRHMSSDDDGSDVSGEIQCLEEMLPKGSGNKNRPCELYLMADRPNTISKLVDYAKEIGCIGVFAVQEKQKDTGMSEHGAFAGAGFFRDLLVLGNAHSAFVGKPRSSSALVLESMEYHQRREAWRKARTVTTDIPKCFIRLNKRPVAD